GRRLAAWCAREGLEGCVAATPQGGAAAAAESRKARFPALRAGNAPQKNSLRLFKDIEKKSGTILYFSGIISLKTQQNRRVKN
ncbi:MAG: hypothetical protein LBK13_02625, partial [Spirochaetales bacterium]|nr:hypothetical protein [Spirochaetales bacterium]